MLDNIVLISNVTVVLTAVFYLSRYVHPRFGQIKCIRTIRAVEKDEELTVAYGYDHEPSGKSGPEAPEWYTKQLLEFQQRVSGKGADETF